MAGRGYRIHSIAFGGGDVEIVFSDESLQSKDVLEIQTRILKQEAFSGQIEEIVEEVEQLLDDAYAHRRNGPAPKPTSGGYDD